MDRKKIMLYIQSGLWVLWAVLMAAAAIHIYTEGLAYQAQGHPETWIYTREKAAAVFGAYAPVLLLAVISTIACVVMGIKDEKQDQPVADPDLISIYKAEREAESVTEHGPDGKSASESAAKNIRIARLAVLVLAVIFVIAGIINGSMEDMIIKAVNICTECVGLG